MPQLAWQLKNVSSLVQGSRAVTVHAQHAAGICCRTTENCSWVVTSRAASDATSQVAAGLLENALEIDSKFGAMWDTEFEKSFGTFLREHFSPSAEPFLLNFL